MLASFISCLRPIQARWVNIHFNYSPFDFTVDSGFVTGSILFLFWLYYYLVGEPAYTLYNTLYSFLASTLIMFWGLVGLYASVKGIQGPTAAVMQVQSIFSTILAAIFLHEIPTLQQCLASLTIIAGVITILLFK